jgi:hypothetical protein
MQVNYTREREREREWRAGGGGSAYAWGGRGCHHGWPGWRGRRCWGPWRRIGLRKVREGLGGARVLSGVGNGIMEPYRGRKPGRAVFLAGNATTARETTGRLPRSEGGEDAAGTGTHVRDLNR